MKVDLVCFGELLWDMLPNGKVVGGAPFNIVNRADSLGLDAFIVTSIGNDILGDELLKTVANKVNHTHFIQRHKSLETSKVEIELSSKGEPKYNIVRPVAWDDIQVDQRIIDLVKSSKALAYSSLALRDERSRSTLFSLLPHAKNKICDINLRAGNYGQSTIMQMVESADTLRMNESELLMLATWLGYSELSQKDQIIAIQKHYNYNEVIATLGAEGAICYDGDSFFIQSVFPTDIKDTVGAGDGFLAAYITRKLKGDIIEEALRYACAVGSITASKRGGTPEISEEEIQQLIDSHS
ncbi:MAG: fructokinase [Saprospiraceae bacterium]|jgi:fructokinase